MMYDELIARIRYHIRKAYFMGLEKHESTRLLNEAADAIGELQKQSNDAWNSGYKCGVDDAAQVDLVKKMSYWWIPVTERLPETGKKVLVFAYGHDILTARMTKLFENVYPVFECNGIFREMAKPGRITHWMPLPEPPDEE